MKNKLRYLGIICITIIVLSVIISLTLSHILNTIEESLVESGTVGIGIGAILKLASKTR